jgi:hypothetical protein
MAEIHLQLPADLHGDGLVAYLNEHINHVRRSLDLDLSWAYIRATVDRVRIIAACLQGGGLRIDYEYDYSAYCACKNLDARDTFTGRATCAVKDGNIVLAEFVPPDRSTLDEF